MKPRAKSKKTKNSLASDGTGRPNVAASSISGAYVLAAQRGDLRRLYQLRKALADVESDLATVTDALKACNDPNWLDKFARAEVNKGRQFERSLPRHVAQLEGRKDKLLAKREGLLTKIRKINGALPEAVYTSLATPFVAAAVTRRIQRPEVGSKVNVSVSARSLVIQKYAGLGDKLICQKLDSELLQRDSPPIGFPDSWRERFGVRTYTEAYENSECRALVQKLISTAK